MFTPEYMFTRCYAENRKIREDCEADFKTLAGAWVT